jgi:hypothetical protein
MPNFSKAFALSLLLAVMPAMPRIAKMLGHMLQMKLWIVGSARYTRTLLSLRVLAPIRLPVAAIRIAGCLRFRNSPVL